MWESRRFRLETVAVTVWYWRHLDTDCCFTLLRAADWFVLPVQRWALRGCWGGAIRSKTTQRSDKAPIWRWQLMIGFLCSHVHQKIRYELIFQQASWLTHDVNYLLISAVWNEMIYLFHLLLIINCTWNTKMLNYADEHKHETKVNM